jgi:hypothetical protein
MTRTEDQSNLDPIFCRCGRKWGEHTSEWSLWGMKPNCVACGELIGRNKYGTLIQNQCQERYIEKGNYCDKCNNKASQHTHSSDLSFEELFKNKQK